MRTHLSAACLLACASLGVAAGCSGEATPTRPSTVMNMHDDPLSGPSVSPDVRQHIAKLKAWSAPFHDLDKAAAAHYDVLFANKCIDETTVGVPRTAETKATLAAPRSSVVVMAAFLRQVPATPAGMSAGTVTALSYTTSPGSQSRTSAPVASTSVLAAPFSRSASGNCS